MMKVLIAYDGSECADNAIADMQRAGLPAEAEALVVSIEEEWLPAPPLSSYEVVEEMTGAETVVARDHGLHREEEPFEAEALARQATARVRELFPAWQVTERSVIGSPASEILQIAEDWGAQLIVIGSHGRTALGRFFFGSVSEKIVTQASCTVRVSRCGAESGEEGERLLIAVDGSLGAEAAVDEVAARIFPAGTEARLVMVCDPLKPSLVGRFIPKVAEWVEESNAEERDWAKDVLNQQAAKLQAKGLKVSRAIKAGDPRRVLLDEAEDWKATTIFVGARGLTKIDRFLLGSVSSAIAQRAECSVEVARKSGIRSLESGV